ncbi:MAG: MEDS domain-containing protein [Holophaga sp.]|jgi:hypothetical protein
MEHRLFERAQGLSDLWPGSGAHILHVYLDEAERRQALVAFFAAGFARGGRICCVHNQPIEEALADPRIGEALKDRGLSGAPAPSRPGGAPADPGRIQAWPSRDWYLASGVFDHARTYHKWQDFCRQSKCLGYPGVWIFGELLPDLGRVADGRVLVTYEMNYEAMVRNNPPTCTVCQYDARAFKGDVLWGVLKAHPLVLVGARVCPNPWFEPSIRVKSH